MIQYNTTGWSQTERHRKWV